MSVALSKPERSTFASEAKRRGLGLSTTIRTLAFERVNEVREEQQRQRARRWQTARLRELIERIETEGFQNATQEQIDAVFAQAAAPPRRVPATRGR